MLYKYLNPNIVVVVTEGEEAASTTSAKGMDVCVCLFVVMYKYLNPNIVVVVGEGKEAGCLHHFS